ncbi:DUF4350 domain-containing protein [Streptomyces apocyni]|uniref:DUF4350 domain-containing protein n=1 Tax=Streptomyces apocyni TaxID=2654677 RepID=UPI0012E9B871|nr:DUF4350 domain-containing protein [Streptomyces apocyni]
MTGAALPSTSLSRSPRQVWTRSRGLLLAFVVLLVTGVTIAVLRSGDQHGRLDPRSADPYGSRAVSELLADRGVTTRVVTTTDAATAAAGPDTTLLVTTPDLLTDRQQSALRSATDQSGGRAVLLAPGPASAGTLAPGVQAETAPFTRLLRPGCRLPEALRAGDAATGGGFGYTSTAPGSDACYPSDGLQTLLRIPAADGDTVLLGAPDILYNTRLNERGNASLALQLLGSRPHLVWYLPSLGDATATDGSDRSFFDLIPSGWRWGALQLTIAAGLAALWRARRLGPLVTERLPVAVRASEAAEGRARLYRKANARNRASEALRSATRTRLAPLLGVPPAQAHSPEALLPAVSAQLPDTAVELRSLLFGEPPPDDSSLIALADQLDALEREVRTS